MKRDRFPQTRRRWVAGFVLVYTTAVTIWYLVTAVVPQGHALLALSTVFGSWLFLPIVPLLFWTGVRRHWQLLPLLLIPLLLFGRDYGRQFLPHWPMRTATADSNGTIMTTPLRIMSWNSYFRNEDPDAFVRTILELQPDLVAVQEINVPLSLAAQTQLRTLLPYQALYPTGDAAGMGLLSRYPLVEQGLPDFDRCNCQQVTVGVNGQEITLLNVHPWPPSLRIDEGFVGLPTIDFFTLHQDWTVDAIIARTEAVDTPLLVVGDFNTGERQPNYWRMRSVLSDAFVEAGWGMGYTFPTVKQVYGIPVFPVVRIDYIFHSAAWQAEAAWVGTIPGADHRYVVADLVLR